MNSHKVEIFARKTNSFLYYLIVLIILVIISISIYTFFSTNNKKNKPDVQPKEQLSINTELQNKLIYTNFGQIRTTTSDMPPIPIVLKPSFSYSSENIPLFEEVAQKNNKLKNIITHFFSEKKIVQLKQLGEENIKTQLLEQINSELIMGNIQAIYFEDYIFLE